MNHGVKVLLTVLGIFAGVVILGLIGFGMKWIGTAVEVVSPDNVITQHEQVIQGYEAMIASAGNICVVQESAEKEEDSRSPLLVESPTLAYEATFRNIVSEYNQAQDNLFKAKIVAPAGYPKSVAVKSLDTTDWCTVADQLYEMKQ